MMGNSTKLLYEILNRLQNYCYPMLDHISTDIETIEKNIFKGYERSMVKEILIVRQNIVNFRKTMQAHGAVLKKLIAKKTKYFIPNSIEMYYANILEQTSDIWDILNNQKETIEALHNTNESLISFRLNDIMKLLTIMSVIIIPGNLIASLFGMNTVFTPLVHHPNGFFIIVLSMLLIMTSLILIFKRKKWL